MKKEDKEQVLEILYGCIVNPEVDEDDTALVDYRKAKKLIMAIKAETEEEPNPYYSVLQLLRDFDLESEWGGNIEELADYICQMFKRGPYLWEDIE